jgi:isopenicillin N synthase-like dioxygenase
MYGVYSRKDITMPLTPISYTAKDASITFFKALKEVGFVILHNHPIDKQLLAKVYDGWRTFFTSTEKYNYLYDGKTLDGYFPLGLEKGKTDYSRDIKEFYYFYEWGKCPENLYAMTSELHNHLVELGNHLLMWIAELLPNEIKQQLSTPLPAMVLKSPRAVLRLLHYPPFDQSLAGNIRAAEHEDLTLLSLLPAALGSGLELKDLNGQWHPAQMDNNALVVNIGDMLQVCTKGYFKATTHRVTNPVGEVSKQSRYAMAFFLNPWDEIILDEQHTASGYLDSHIKKKLSRENLNSFSEKSFTHEKSSSVA